MIIKLLIFLFSYMIILHVLNILFPITEGINFKKLKRKAKKMAKKAGNVTQNVVQQASSSVQAIASGNIAQAACPAPPKCDKPYYDENIHMKKKQIKNILDDIEKIQDKNIVSLDDQTKIINQLNPGECDTESFRLIEPFGDCPKHPPCKPAFRSKVHIKKKDVLDKLKKAHQENCNQLDTIKHNMDSVNDSKCYFFNDPAKECEIRSYNNYEEDAQKILENAEDIQTKLNEINGSINTIDNNKDLAKDLGNFTKTLSGAKKARQ